ncbi:MAG: hypothetical protein AAFP26_13915 [Planctomycetota bacterium]
MQSKGTERAVGCGLGGSVWRRRALGVACVLVAGGTLASCGKHYRVSDPASGSTYYTKDVNNLRGGAVRFNDAATGERVTLQDSQVERVNKKEYKRGKKGE